MTIYPNKTTEHQVREDESSPPISTTTTSTTGTIFSSNNFTYNKQRRNKIMSLFPSNKNEDMSNNSDTTSTKWQTTAECNNNNNNSNNKTQIINCPTSTSFYNSPTTNSSSTITTSSSSSSTIYQMPIATNKLKPNFKVVHPSCIPDYANLQKIFTKFQSKSKQRISILQEQLLPWFQKYTLNLRFQSDSSSGLLEEEETGFWGLKNVTKENKELQFGRSILLKWWRLLLSNMLILEADDRQLYYESIIEIMSRNLDFIGSQWTKNENVPQTTSVDDYRQLLKATLKYAIDKLNQKAIYSNMISFCAKVLALCYFKVPGLAPSLLQVLKIRPTIMKKLKSEMTSSNTSYYQQQHYKDELQCVFPPLLRHLMLSDSLSYQSYFTSVKSQKLKSPVSSSGNWVRRWQSDDSELFFSFYRHYHSILKSHVSIVLPGITKYQLHQRNAMLMNLPGYMYLASFFACKISSLTNREINSVTTLADQQKQSNSNSLKGMPLTTKMTSSRDYLSMIDEAVSLMSTNTNASESSSNTIKAHCNIPVGKPKALIMATKRYAECMVWCIVAADPPGLFYDMINVWLRFAVKQTILTEAGGVYCILDFIEQTILELQKFPLPKTYFPIDLPFILHSLDVILSQSDHTTSLLRALSFIYVHFKFLTSHAALLDLLCNRILLDTQIFERLLLHWGRVWQSSGIRWNSETEQMMKTIVPKNANSNTVCNGYSCWAEWTEDISSSSNTDSYSNQLISAELIAYRKCSLEVHILLEALLASFHRQHSTIQQSKMCSNLDISTLINKSECSTPIPERITKFSSKIAITPPQAVLLSSFEETDKPNLTSGCQKRFKTSPYLMKKTIALKSKTGKDILFNLFNGNCSNTTLTQGYTTTHDSIDNNNDIVSKERNEHDMMMNEEEENQNEFYTVSSHYTVSSPIPAFNNNILEKKRYPNLDSTDNVLFSQKESKKPFYQKSPSFSDNDEDELINISEDDKPIKKKTNRIIEPPNMIISSRNWKYRPYNHVYATKVMTDIRVILHEYCIWLEKIQATVDSPVIFVPRLSLEWPKNWSYSQT